MLTGFRRNEEKLTAEPGHERGTNAYQSFSESFALGFPVEGKHLTREFSGERLTVIVPKAQSGQARARESTVKIPVRATVERPSFPANLPHTALDQDSAKVDGAPDRPLG